ncbi:hypothetical protein SHKM778_58300 [Streptomyces sp. KM77-8]|uniref:Uracil-DNA glycosylase n=1 Tax=Streptomyces haneummycinicus TaxID=3074435 RepID=A0AAT9HPE7_9ACTN
MAPRPLNEIVEAGWAKALEPVAERVAGMGDFLRAEIAAGRTYLPAGANVLRAFQQPFDEVRVLIVGQDPYPTRGTRWACRSRSHPKCGSSRAASSTSSGS